MKIRSYHFYWIMLIGCFSIAIQSCVKDKTTFESSTSYLIGGEFNEEEEAILTTTFNEEAFNFVKHNAWTSDQFKPFLGRALFYDHHLSKDQSVACASCHQQQFGFADTVALSRGASNNLTDRNSIGLASFVSFSGHYEDHADQSLIDNSFFWDERAGELADQMMETFANPKEMGMELSEIPKRVEELDYATVLYKRSFEDQPVTTENVIEAISSFVKQINSFGTPFDENLIQTSFQVKENFRGFSEAQNMGKRLFIENCASCHAFSLDESFREQFDNFETTASNGLNVTYEDQGLANHTFLPEDEGVFKIPGLRNIEVTAPYMHDGRFASLEEVVEFYSSGIQAHPNLNPKLKADNGEPIKMNFTEEEKEGLVAFLKTLTGTSSHFGMDLSDPFK